jgi:glucan phosphoethanolaminetransferase (alkaline phosphatase superfamily)
MRKISSRNIGLITAALMVASSLVMFYVFKQPETGNTKYMAYSIYALGVILSLFLYSKSVGTDKEFGSYFSEGFKTFVIVVLVMAIFTFVFYKINPQILANTLLQINKVNSLDPNKTAAEVLENSNKVKSIFMPMNIAINTVIYLILGAIISVIGAGFLSQKNK